MARPDAAVEHPPHYGGADDPYETIKVMEDRLSPAEFDGAMKFQVYKYLDRAGKKEGQTQLRDVQKAAWYANRWAAAIERREALDE